MGIFSGSLYVKDFVKDLELREIQVSDAELENILKIADKSGRVRMQVL